MSKRSIFFAFAARDQLIAGAIEDACRDASSDTIAYTPWRARDLTGQPIDAGVANWVEEADAVFADISYPNHNVTFEIAYAMALGKPIYLVRQAQSDINELESIGLLHNLGHKEYADRSELTKILKEADPKPINWGTQKRASLNRFILFSLRRLTILSFVFPAR